MSAFGTKDIIRFISAALVFEAAALNQADPPAFDVKGKTNTM